VKDQYPDEAIRILDQYFPKGDKRRGEVMVILAIAFLEGEKKWMRK
jgi:hypothetical protein